LASTENEDENNEDFKFMPDIFIPIKTPETGEVV